MSNSLLGPTAPTFDEPLAMLDACHGRIQAQLQTLRRLAAWLPHHGLDEQATQAATAVLRYFTQAAPHHHADEEQDVLPALLTAATTASADDQEQARCVVARILREHGEMEVARKAMLIRLQGILDRRWRELPVDEVEGFAGLYERHIVLETEQLLPLAGRLLSAEVQAELGVRMAQRRGADPA
jgi:pyridoxamine 5'-phosphate oxidase